MAEINKLKELQEEDLIKSNYAKDGEYSFGGIFHDEETDYSLKEEEC